MAPKNRLLAFIYRRKKSKATLKSSKIPILNFAQQMHLNLMGSVAISTISCDTSSFHNAQAWNSAFRFTIWIDSIHLSESIQMTWSHKKSDCSIQPQLVVVSMQSLPTLPVCTLYAGIIHLVLFHNSVRIDGLLQLTRAQRVSSVSPQSLIIISISVFLAYLFTPSALRS